MRCPTTRWGTGRNTSYISSVSLRLGFGSSFTADHGVTNSQSVLDASRFFQKISHTCPALSSNKLEDLNALMAYNSDAEQIIRSVGDAVTEASGLQIEKTEHIRSQRSLHFRRRTRRKKKQRHKTKRQKTAIDKCAPTRHVGTPDDNKRMSLPNMIREWTPTPTVVHMKTSINFTMDVSPPCHPKHGRRR